MIENVIQPVGWQLLLKPRTIKKQTDGGIILPEQHVTENEVAALVCEVIAVGPMAYQDQNKFGDTPWCAPGDFVMIAKYTGNRFSVNDQEYKLINDDQILGKALDPDKIKRISLK